MCLGDGKENFLYFYLWPLKVPWEFDWIIKSKTHWIMGAQDVRFFLCFKECDLIWVVCLHTADSRWVVTYFIKKGIWTPSTRSTEQGCWYVGRWIWVYYLSGRFCFWLILFTEQAYGWVFTYSWMDASELSVCYLSASQSQALFPWSWQG